MEIKGKVHCFFEQSGTFKNEFIKLGIPAEDYDIQNNFGQTDHITDLFGEIDRAYDNLIRQDKTRQDKTLFDSIDPCQDLIVAFFPCVHFCGISQTWFSLNHRDYKKWDYPAIFENILKKNEQRSRFFELINKLVCICLANQIRIVLENPWQGQQFLRVFLKQPDIVDNNRMIRGDYMIKPTAYWFFNCEPTHGLTVQNDKKRIEPMNLPKAKEAGLCSEERSMISPDYARNWICDFILGKYQEDISGPLLFDIADLQ